MTPELRETINEAYRLLAESRAFTVTKCNPNAKRSNFDLKALNKHLLKQQK